MFDIRVFPKNNNSFIGHLELWSSESKILILGNQYKAFDLWDEKHKVSNIQGCCKGL